MRKIICLLLAALLLLSMAACSVEEPTPTEPATTVAPETTAAPETTETTAPAINTHQTLVDALDSQRYVELADAVELESFVVMQSGELNGNGYTLTAPAYVEEEKATHGALVVQSGIVSDLTIQGGYRALSDMGGTPVIGDVRLRNVWIEAETNAMFFSYGNAQHILNAEDCTFYGWSNVKGFRSAYFENCTFGKGGSKAKGNLRTHVDTVLVDCHFESRTTANGTVQPYAILFKDNISGVTITMENCYVDGVLITEENVYELLEIKLYDNILRIQNTTE